MRPARLSALLSVCVLVASCSPAPAPSSSSSSSSAASTPASSADPPAITEQPGPTPAPTIPTSETLIAAALTSGAITYEQSLLYRALALFDSPGLPKEFHAKVPDMHAAGDLLGEIDDKEATLSPGLLQQLAPYRVRPSDPTSIFNNPPARAGVPGGLAVALAADTVTTWQSQLVTGGAARVWVKSSAGAATQLSQHAQDVARVWAQYPGIFTYPMPDTPNSPSPALNPDSAIDFYFVNASDLDPRRPECAKEPGLAECLFGTANYGYAQRAFPYPGNKSSAYLVIDAATGGDQLVDTLAHELAHAGQFAYDRHDSSWLMESTATWTAYRVMKKLRLTPAYSYAWLQQFFYGLDQSLPRLDDHNAYASWLFFEFASMELGDGIVTAVWKEAAAEGVQGLKAVDKVFSFDTHFADFAVRNWNKDPVERQYKTADDTFPKGYQPGTRNKVKTLAGGKQDALDVSLPPLASAYYEYVFPVSTRDVTFDNTLVGVANAHVWGIKNVSEDWKRPEDWTAKAKPTFCRDITDEDLGQVIIVVTNTSLTKPLKVTEPPKVVAGIKGCPGWQGTMTGTYSWHLGSNHGTGTATFTGVWVPSPIDQPIAPCQSGLPDGCIAYVPHGNIHWTWDAHSANPACSETRAGDFPAGAVNDPRNAGGGSGVPLSAQMLVLQPDGADHYGYWGRASWGSTDKMHCSNGDTVIAPPSYFDLSQDATGSGVADPGGSTCGNTTWQIDTKADTIKGSCFDWNNSGSSSQFEWSLKRTGGPPGS